MNTVCSTKSTGLEGLSPPNSCSIFSMDSDGRTARQNSSFAGFATLQPRLAIITSISCSSGAEDTNCAPSGVLLVGKTTPS
mmetsp:Transcript_2191/g.3453  ORF Transcript_2191/g.3453 Transcript_2191/m.3453 type:complete len:81 (-) Transcript_2191:265-507(-)